MNIMTYDKKGGIMKENICWHCGDPLPIGVGSEIFCVLNKKTDKLELKPILHTPCYIKLRNEGLI